MEYEFNPFPQEPKQELERETNKNVIFPTNAKQEIEYPKEVIVAQKSATESDCNRLTTAAKGRLESDIPLNDPYWDIRGQILSKNRGE